MVRIDRQEAEKLPHLSQRVALEKYKDDYVVGLTFTHAMHCLNALRKLYYPKRYNNSMFDKDGNVMYEYWWHTDHCIEIIRRYIACHADTTAFTYDWIKDTSILVHPGTVHTCKNFDRVDDVSGQAASLHIPQYIYPRMDIRKMTNPRIQSG